MFRRFTPTLAALAALIGLAHSPAAAVGVGETAPAFRLLTADGTAISLEALRGQVVYVDFWASWCGPCKRSFPWMNELEARLRGRGFSVVAINVDKQRTDAQRFLATTPASFTVVYDAAGTSPAAYSVKGMPSSYLVDRAGRVVHVESGFRDDAKAALEARIVALLNQRP